MQSNQPQDSLIPNQRINGFLSHQEALEECDLRNQRIAKLQREVSFLNDVIENFEEDLMMTSPKLYEAACNKWIELRDEHYPEEVEEVDD